jgi:hypothetical protein
MREPPKAGQIVALRCRIPQSEIGYVRFVLEGHEGLAIQTSPPRSNIVTWEVPRSRLDEALQLLDALREETGLERLDSPK